MDFNSGGKKVMERLVEAYGFTTRQALCDHLGVSKSTMATRYMRDIFPADWVLQCAMETGISLEWLSFGKGQKQITKLSNTSTIDRKMLLEGKLSESEPCIFDNCFLPENIRKPILISERNTDYICDMVYEEVRDGKWLVNIEGDISIRMLIRLPRARLQVSNDNHTFQCNVSDIEIIAKVQVTCFK